MAFLQSFETVVYSDRPTVAKKRKLYRATSRSSKQQDNIGMFDASLSLAIRMTYFKGQNLLFYGTYLRM